VGSWLASTSLFTASNHAFFLECGIFSNELIFITCLKERDYCGMDNSYCVRTFWIYPDKIAHGGDSSLAHLPYYELQKKAIQYFDNHQIELEQVETFFPSQGALDSFFLNGDQRIIDGYEGKRKYVIYSNINNLSDEEYDYIHSSAYTLIETLEKNRVFVKIFKKVLE
jgi:hypothetical protein